MNVTLSAWKLDELYWQKAIEFTEEVKKYLEQGDYVIDIYFTSTGEILIIDFNSWGEPTEVLLLKIGIVIGMK